VIEKVWEGNIDDYDKLDGYEELPDDVKEKVREVFERGYIADEDWRHAPGGNRPNPPAAKRTSKKVCCRWCMRRGIG
jgi:hypothetical protein